MGKVQTVILLTFATLIGIQSEELDKAESTQREAKLLPIFQVVTFPNDICVGSGSRNGTCYTAEECSAKGGSAQGTCASGFGVCCVFTGSCGSTISENCTYLTSTGATSADSPCTYKICKCSSDICRIRLDFLSFVIAGPFNGISTTEVPDPPKGSAADVGDCLTDTFSIGGTGGQTTPVICGTNSGSHMFIDAADACNKATFTINDGSVTTTRSYDIKITQYKCSDQDIAGPPGCLQYYTSTAGIVQSFNFPASAPITSKATHLSNQNYDICIRRGVGFCYICYSPTVIGTVTNANQNSFGLGLSGAAIATAIVGAGCTQDYLDIPGAETAVIAAIFTTQVNTGINRLCGRVFAIADADAAGETICTNKTPFRLGFITDGGEVLGVDAAATSEGAAAAETSRTSGHVGFKLTYFQMPC